MLSRLAYTHTRRRMCSKKFAGEWALETMPERFRGLIKSQMSDYSGETGKMDDENLLLEYETRVRDYIAELRTN